MMRRLYAYINKNADFFAPLIAGLILLVVLGAMITAVAVPPYFEAQSYNRLTGSNATYWDAVWVELRVQGCSDAE
jgi:hypothetical protein